MTELKLVKVNNHILNTFKSAYNKSGYIHEQITASNIDTLKDKALQINTSASMPEVEKFLDNTGAYLHGAANNVLNVSDTVRYMSFDDALNSRGNCWPVTFKIQIEDKYLIDMTGYRQPSKFKQLTTNQHSTKDALDVLNRQWLNDILTSSPFQDLFFKKNKYRWNAGGACRFSIAEFRTEMAEYMSFVDNSDKSDISVEISDDVIVTKIKSNLVVKLLKCFDKEEYSEIDDIYYSTGLKEHKLPGYNESHAVGTIDYIVEWILGNISTEELLKNTYALDSVISKFISSELFLDILQVVKDNLPLMTSMYVELKAYENAIDYLNTDYYRIAKKYFYSLSKIEKESIDDDSLINILDFVIQSGNHQSFNNAGKLLKQYDITDEQIKIINKFFNDKFDVLFMSNDEDDNNCTYRISYLSKARDEDVKSIRHLYKNHLFVNRKILD